MVKLIFNIFVVIVIFSTALYTGFFTLLIQGISTVNSDFIAYLPMEARIGFLAVMLGLGIAFVKGFYQ